MSSALEILARHKNAVRRRFLAFVRLSPAWPAHLVIPADAEAALRLGIQMGRQKGYGEGLVEGTRLGLDVGLDTVDALMSQPVIFSSVGLS